MSSACISIHRKKRWCCVATRNHNVRRWSVPSLACRWASGISRSHARLYSSWHFDSVCCAKLSGGEPDHNHLRTTPASGMPGIPQENRTGNTERSGYPSDCRQLRNPQTFRVTRSSVAALLQLRNWQIEFLPIWLTAIKIQNVMSGMPRAKKFCGKFSVPVMP